MNYKDLSSKTPTLPVCEMQNRKLIILAINWHTFCNIICTKDILPKEVTTSSSLVAEVSILTSEKKSLGIWVLKITSESLDRLIFICNFNHTFMLWHHTKNKGNLSSRGRAGHHKGMPAMWMVSHKNFCNTQKLKTFKYQFELLQYHWKTLSVKTNLAVSGSKDVVDADHDFIRTVQMATVFECLWVFFVTFCNFSHIVYLCLWELVF